MTHSQEFLGDKFARVGVGTTPKGLAFIEFKIDDFVAKYWLVSQQV